MPFYGEWWSRINSLYCKFYSLNIYLVVSFIYENESFHYYYYYYYVFVFLLVDPDLIHSS